MKVKELIELLSKQNQELEVVLGEDWEDVDTIREDDNNGIQQPVIVIN